MAEMPKRSGTWNVSLEDPRQKSGPPLANPAREQAADPPKPALTNDTSDRIELFIVEQPIRSLDDLIVSPSTRQQIDNLLAKVLYHRELYEDWDLQKIDPYGGRTAINLYGPPGTGKSFCAEAIAHNLKRGFIRVNYAEIESKYVGETPKNIKAAFAKARQENVVLFFDEADSILGKRLTHVTQSADHGVNVSRSVMLLELDHFNGVVIFATNLASNYDNAFVRRILGHVEMPLPDVDCLMRLWKYHLPERMPRDLSEQDFDVLVQASQGLSGGDVLNAVISSATIAVQRLENRRVTRQDLLKAVESIRKAKRDVGAVQELSRESQIVPIAEAPEDVRKRYSQA